MAWLFADNPDIFVAGDLLWYPVEGDNKLRQAPDVMVVFGVSKGDRGSYQQWKENNIAPQVVWEILSPGNTFKEMSRKLLFYDRYGVEEYYVYDPQQNELTGWLRSQYQLDVIDNINGWSSPRLGIKFELNPDTMVLYYPDGKAFKDYNQVQRAKIQAEEELQKAEEELQQTQQQLQQTEQQLQAEKEKSQRLEQLLQEAGIDT